MKIIITLLFILSCLVSNAYNHDSNISRLAIVDLTSYRGKSCDNCSTGPGISAIDQLILSAENEIILDIFRSDSFNIEEAVDQRKHSRIVVCASNMGEKTRDKSEIKSENAYGRRNVFAIGYQIGGWTLLGINYEIRFSDYIGAHFGIGLSGYTLGTKFHFNKLKNSSFINLSYKDGGFGLFETFGGELGGRLPLSKENDFGLHAQIGIGYIIAIDNSFSEKLFNNGETPSVILSFGIGFSW